MSEYLRNPFQSAVDGSPLLAQVNDWEELQTFEKGINLTGLAALPNVASGQVLHYGKRFYIDSANRRVISRASDSMLTPVTVANTDVDTLLWEGNISANTLAVGKVYRASVYGQFTTANSGSILTIRVKLNNNELAQITSHLGIVTDKAGFAQAYITIRSIGVAGTVTCFSSFQLANKSFHANNSSVNLDSTSGSNIQISAQWSSALENNICIADQGLLEAMN